MFFGIVLYAQTPQSFKYQVAIRDNSGNLLANKLVAVKLSLIKTSASGNIVYSEIHQTTTSDFGIANINVGEGTPLSGAFSSLDWGDGPYFLKTELDINNGTNFLFMGTTQLLSVPYALYAGKAANATDDKDKDSLNEIQNLNLTGTTLSISKGNSIQLSGVVDLDSDPTNEIQTLSNSKDTLRLSKANYVILPRDNDGDSTNEIQTLSITGNKLSLTKGNQVNIDSDTLNEIQNLSVTGNKLNISKSNQVNIDGDTLNEIQTISQSGNTISLSKGGSSVLAVTPVNIQNGSLLFASASGINNILLTLNPSISQYSLGMMINFKNPSTNSSSVTLNINGLGPKNLLKNGTDTLKGGDLLIYKMVNVIYDGINFQLLNHSNNSILDYASFSGFTIGTNTFYKPGVAGTWVNIPCDSIKSNIGNSITKLGDTIVLKSGTYKIKAGALIYGSGPNSVMVRIFNLSDNKSEIVAPGNYMASNISLWTELEGLININSEKKYLFQFITLTGGGGQSINSISNNWGLENHYSKLIIERIK
jgi:hypothetical protein